MIQTILAFFGYCKIPKEVIQISIISEDLFSDLLKNAIENSSKQTTIDHVKLVFDGQKAITEFLRSGKLLQ